MIKLNQKYVDRVGLTREQVQEMLKTGFDKVRLTPEQWNKVRCPMCGRMTQFGCKRRHIIPNDGRTD